MLITVKGIGDMSGYFVQALSHCMMLISHYNCIDLDQGNVQINTAFATSVKRQGHTEREANKDTSWKQLIKDIQIECNEQAMHINSNPQQT
jgi:hypothetical protein